MKIEKELIQLKPYDLLPASQGGQLTLRHSGRHFQVNANQYSMLEALRSNSMSLESLVQFYLGQGWLVSFRELHALVHFLIQESAFVNPAFAAYFLHHEQAPLLAAKKAVPVSRELPFLRSLAPNLADHFIKNSQVLKLKAQTRIVAQQERSRDLYIVLSGQLGIYKTHGANRERTSILGSGALFGERGFLLGQARSADVICLTDCDVLKIPFLPEYEQLIRTDKAQSLQHRFWVLQALASSDFFSSLPSDSHDALIFSGRLVQSPAYQVLFREGQPGNSCYIIVQGSAVVSQKGQNINIMNQGACFGEISLLMSGGVRTATVTTQTDSILLEINQNHFYQVLAQNLVLAKKNRRTRTPTPQQRFPTLSQLPGSRETPRSEKVRRTFPLTHARYQK